MPLIESDRISCLLKAINCSTFSGKLDRQELVKLLRQQANKKLVSKVLDSGKCFVAATKLEREFVGPAILLYVAAVDIFRDGPNKELKKHIKEAKKLFKEKEIGGNENVEAIVKTASDAAIHKPFKRFAVGEFEEGLRKANYSEGSLYNVNDPRDLAERIVKASNAVRHQAKIDWTKTVELFITADGTLQSLEQKKKKELEERGSYKVAKGPIHDICSLTVASFSELIQPARLGSANAITKRVEELKCGKSKT